MTVNVKDDKGGVQDTCNVIIIEGDSEDRKQVKKPSMKSRQVLESVFGGRRNQHDVPSIISIQVDPHLYAPPPSLLHPFTLLTMVDTLSVIASHFIGVILASLFYGFTLTQTWRYFRTYPRDRWTMKALVAFLWALDTAQLALVAASIYHYTVVWQGDVEMSSRVSIAFEVVALSSQKHTQPIAVNNSISGAIHIFPVPEHMLTVYGDVRYTQPLSRIYTKSSLVSFGNILVTFFIVLLALVALGSGGAMIIKTVRDPLWDSTHVSNLPASSFYLSSMACDVLIAATQVYLFHKSRTGIGRLGGLITRLTVLVVNVGLITSIDVTLFLILFLVCPRNGAFLVPYILMSHCYLNSFLSVTNLTFTSLNSRLELRELVDNDDVGDPVLIILTAPNATPLQYACPSIYTAPDVMPSQHACPSICTVASELA
ncbi:hypothetical protein DFH29DRAFT_876362 [Suillus ampliporus]|nr:hypothetical protein DFH29DRAFT_876362 [Suillus ampliporus]